MRDRPVKPSRVMLPILGAALIGNGGCGGTTPEIRLGLSVEPDSLSLRVGQQAEVSAGVSTTNVGEIEVAFRVRDSDIATVTRRDDRSATVMGQSPGQTVISVVAASEGPDPMAIEDSVHVSVKER